MIVTSKERSGGNGPEAHSTTQLLTTLVLSLMGWGKRRTNSIHILLVICIILNLKVGFVHVVFVGLKMPSTFSIFPKKITAHFSF